MSICEENTYSIYTYMYSGSVVIYYINNKILYNLIDILNKKYGYNFYTIGHLIKTNVLKTNIDNMLNNSGLDDICLLSFHIVDDTHDSDLECILDLFDLSESQQYYPKNIEYKNNYENTY